MLEGNHVIAAQNMSYCITWTGYFCALILANTVFDLNEKYDSMFM